MKRFLSKEGRFLFAKTAGFIRVEGFNTPPNLRFALAAVIIGIKLRQTYGLIQYLLRSNIPRCSAAGLLIPALLILTGVFWGCKSAPFKAAHYRPGIYEGSGNGFRGPIKLKAALSPYGIEDIEILEHREDEAIGGAAMEELREQILEYGYAPETDAVSGATASTSGFLEALENALLKGKH